MGKFLGYYLLTSERPAIMLALIQTIQKLIPEHLDFDYVDEELNFLDDPFNDLD